MKKDYEKNAKNVHFEEVPEEKENPETEPEQNEEIKEKNPKTHKFLFWDVTVEKAEKPAKKTKEHKIPLAVKVGAVGVAVVGVGAAVVKAFASEGQEKTESLESYLDEPDTQDQIEGYTQNYEDELAETQTSNEETKEENE